MPARRFLAPLAVLIALLASPELSADVTFDSVLPDEGTVGTLLDVRLEGDLGKGKPKLWLTHSMDESAKPKKTKLKVTTITDLGNGESSVSAFFKKTKTGPGLYHLHVKPKGSGQVEQIFEAVFTVVAPMIDDVTPETAASKELITITGGFFGGPKKPVVRLISEATGKQKKAKVKEVTGGTELVVKLPKLKPGTYQVQVSNKVGSSLAAHPITSTGNPGDGFIRATFASDANQLLVTNFFSSSSPSGSPPFAGAFSSGSTGGPGIAATQLVGARLIGFQGITLGIAFEFEPGVTPTPHVIDMEGDSAVFVVSLGQSKPLASWDEADGVPGRLTITSSTATRIQGTFEFDLAIEDSEPPVFDLHITNGEFDLPVQSS
ncbi:MAG: hypothetical protein DHS20C15_34670 [Planctomycetota bacterium]|nr:MAG: hypothetical protein DHS20C15_34670 [Planctomycetota bacterium]